MDLSKYDSLGAEASTDLVDRYHALRRNLQALCSAPFKDMQAIDKVIVELDEIQAGVRDKAKGDGDPQRY